MVANSQYTDREQSPAQRQALIDKGRAWNVAQGAIPSPAAEAVYARYVAGELTLQGVTDELVKHYQAMSPPPTPAAAPGSSLAAIIEKLDAAFPRPSQEQPQRQETRQMQPERLELA